ncbi:hypothetical protein F0267_01890 [Vibrio coralliilyticus]|uniref:Uncharacterized protein n=2 Tax=Vibrio TaxID=662 RepID=A0AAN0W167_9VIBR|nr:MULTISPECIES: hypothetical protein [Vibrio]CAH1587974.1 conserved hypothetical protein [Vibrio jasicida]AIW22416.1 hypothetical protein IX92_25455 [Vibrio coralliilyticus]MCZ2799075.1 hypothetical protein [Vibrio alginolyticus]NOH36976.1 hypothetical protein [Vibrio coralliilyticus]PAW02492.1 hypothetical protein CKJ79_17660 [Vibrio coralliilyticus]
MKKYITFNSLAESERFKDTNPALIEEAHSIASSYEGVAYTETWLCCNCPSHIAGFDKDDEILVSVPLLVSDSNN